MVDKEKLKEQRIAEAEPYEGYWDDSYGYAFSLLEKFFEEGSSERMLELGCGRGEFIGRYAEYFDQVVAIEKDSQNLDKAMENAYGLGIDNITFLSDPSNEESLDSESFDFILMGRSLQHMSSEDLSQTMQKSVELLKNKGKLALIVPHRKPGQAEYTKTHINLEGEYVAEAIDLEEFNRLAESSKGDLTVRRFRPEDFEEIEGLSLVDHRVFQDVLLPSFIDRFVSRDFLINLPVLEKYFGSRLLVVLEKE